MLQLGLQFLVGVVILLFSTRVFVRSAEKISLAFRVSPLGIGATVVAIGTSLPELAVSVIASLKGDVGLALGNIIGSNITNIFLVLPVGILIGKLRIGTTKTQKNVLMLTIATLLFIFFYLWSVPSFVAGKICLAGAILVTIIESIWGITGRTHEDVKRYKKINKVFFRIHDVLIILATIGGIILGGLIVVASVQQLSLLTGLSTTVLGLSLSAIATSLPELMTTIFSERDHEDKMTIGDIMGSNLYNLLLIGGLSLTISSWGTIGNHELVTLVGSTAILMIITLVFKGKVIPKYIGFLLLILFVYYIYQLKPK